MWLRVSGACAAREEAGRAGGSEVSFQLAVRLRWDYPPAPPPPPAPAQKKKLTTYSITPGPFREGVIPPPSREGLLMQSLASEALWATVFGMPRRAVGCGRFCPRGQRFVAVSTEVLTMDPRHRVRRVDTRVGRQKRRRLRFLWRCALNLTCSTVDPWKGRWTPVIALERRWLERTT